MLKGYKHNSILELLLILFIIMPACIYAQHNLVCDYCNKKITGRYIQAENKYFHPDHFICARCKKVISGSYMEKDDNFYHPNCYALSEGFICSFCNKVIKSEYVEDSGKKYHKDCYENNIVPKCAVCGKPLNGKYSVDTYNNMYHSFHNNELFKCDNCGRIICKSLTNDGMEYSDGRHICNICYKEAVFNMTKINSLFKGVITRLKSFGLSYNDNNISIKAVDLSGLKKAAGNSYESNMRGFCQTSEESKYINHKLSKKFISHTIYVLNGIPSVNIEAILAHELMHVWINENTKSKQSDALREGSCNFMSFLYLNSLKNNQAMQVIKQLEEDPDDVYGKGFLRVKSKFENQNITRLLDYLRTEKNI